MRRLQLRLNSNILVSGSVNMIYVVQFSAFGHSLYHLISYLSAASSANPCPLAKLVSISFNSFRPVRSWCINLDNPSFRCNVFDVPQKLIWPFSTNCRIMSDKLLLDTCWLPDVIPNDWLNWLKMSFRVFGNGSRCCLASNEPTDVSRVTVNTFKATFRNLTSVVDQRSLPVSRQSSSKSEI